MENQRLIQTIKQVIAKNPTCINLFLMTKNYGMETYLKLTPLLNL